MELMPCLRALRHRPSTIPAELPVTEDACSGPANPPPSPTALGKPIGKKRLSPAFGDQGMWKDLRQAHSVIVDERIVEAVDFRGSCPNFHQLLSNRRAAAGEVVRNSNPTLLVCALIR